MSGRGLRVCNNGSSHQRFMLSYTQASVALNSFRDNSFYETLKYREYILVNLANALLRYPMRNEEDLMANQYFFKCIGIEQVGALKNIAFSHEDLIRDLLSIPGIKPEEIRRHKDKINLFKYLSVELASMKLLGKEVKELSDSSKTNEARNALSQLNEKGYYVAEKQIEEKMCETIREEIYEIAMQEDLRSKSYRYGNDKSSQRIYHLLFKSSTANKLLDNELTREVLDGFFDRQTNHDLYYLTSWHANILGPGAKAQKVHVDENIPDPLPSWPIRLNVNFIVEDFTSQNGATIVYPGSHKMLAKPYGVESRKKVCLEAKTGAIVFWTGKLWHQSGANLSAKPRVGLLAGFCNSVMRELVSEEDNIRVYSMRKDRQVLSSKILNLIGKEHGIKDNEYLQ